MEIPSHCVFCGAFLMGSLTVHKPECEIRQIIDEHFSPSFTCPTCGMVSYNTNDIKHRYCGNCHVFFDENVMTNLPPLKHAN